MRGKAEMRYWGWGWSLICKVPRVITMNATRLPGMGSFEAITNKGVSLSKNLKIEKVLDEKKSSLSAHNQTQCKDISQHSIDMP